MRFSIFILLNFASVLLGSCTATTPFDSLFYRRTLRLDFQLAGDAHSAQAFFGALRDEPQWGGSRSQLIDHTGWGAYRVVMLSAAGDTLYTRGFCTLFQEWQSTAEASTLARAFQQSVVMPYPRRPVVVHIEERRADNLFHPILQLSVQPDSPAIIRDAPVVGQPVEVMINGDVAACVDVVFVAEGYTAQRQEQFLLDVHRMSEYLFTMEPFRRHQSRFNVRAVKVVSPDGGTDDPLNHHWVNTPFQSSFNGLGIDRYLLTEQMFMLRDAVAGVPGDVVVLLVDSPLYGGAGIYNHFVVATAHHAQSLPVFVHEMGHALAGLADEYYDSEVSYPDFIDKTKEPWYPNITTLVDFDRKWKHLLTPATPVPTPDTHAWRNHVGVFEGAAYSAKGIYRPASDCRMKNNTAPGFCPVCQQAIEKIINQLTQ